MERCLACFKYLILLCLSTLLVACGGGGSSDASPSPESPPESPSYNFNDVADYLAVNSYSTSEALLQLGLVAENAVVSNQNVVDSSEQDCSNGGFSKITLVDKDEDGVISSGDSLSIAYNGCYVTLLDDTAQGTLSVNIVSFDKSTSSANLQVDASKLEVSDDAIVVNGIMNFSFANSDVGTSSSLSSEKSISVYFSGSLADEINNLSVKRTVNYGTAVYNMSASGSINDHLVNLSYKFNQDKPWSGYLAEYPVDGKMTITAQDGNTISISTDTYAALGHVRESWGGQDYITQWSDYSEGVLWSLKFGSDPEPKSYSASNLRFVGYVNSTDLSAFDTNGLLKMVFSRPIKQIDNVDNYSLYSNSGGHAVVVPATVSANGAVVTIAPNQPLHAGYIFRAPTFGVEGSNSGYIAVNSFDITVTDAVSAVMSLQSGVFRPGDTPKLSAARSSSKKGGTLHYLWQDVSGSGVVFSNSDKADTSFTVPQSTVSDIAIRLTVSNDIGQSASVENTIHYLDPSSTQLIANLSDPDDPAGGGEFAKFISGLNGNIVFSYFRNDELSIQSLGSPFFQFYITAPDVKKIKLGQTYRVSTLYPDTSSNSTTFKLIYNQLPCSLDGSGSGEFTVYQMDFDGSGMPSKFAANFIQRCAADGESASYGVIRVNSDYPLNP